MFAPRVATSQTKGDAGSTGRFEQRTSRQAKDERDGDHEREVAGESLTDLPPRRLAWDFGKISLFPPDRPSRSEASYSLPGIIQPKLVVGAVNDPLEHEADRVADQVMHMPAPEAGPIPTAAPPQISRKCAACEEDEKNTLQTKSAATAKPVGGVPPIVHEVLRSPGQPLGAATRAYMEPRFRHDFSKVQLHTDERAAESARAIGALAYTGGQHIAFDSGQYAPNSASGRRLLAHELAHVVQQTRLSIPGGGQFSSGLVQRQAGSEGEDPWNNLNEVDREIAEEQLDTANSYLKLLATAQQYHRSLRRTDWINALHLLAAQIGAVDRRSKLLDIESDIPTFVASLEREASKYTEEWLDVEKHYKDQHSWLLSSKVKSTDSVEASKYL